MKKQGRLKSWNDDKGFGFISVENDEGDHFIHISAFKKRGFRPQLNQQIIFTPSKDNQGRPRAIGAYVLGHNTKTKKDSKRRQSTSILSIGFSVAFLLLIVALVALDKLPGIILYWYLMLSILLFALYKSDKQAAKLQYWRTKENTLHILSLLGGWPGALVAQQTLRHKSSKTSFRVLYFLTLIINLSGFVWLFSKQGESILGFVDAGVKIGLTELSGFVSSLFSLI